ncbi:aspartate aminotransferase family protein [bacterium (Candidatus Blackallbacteria) CG17_big_fil_post_rev_8_21_14_2_50_48_46]|uniref:Aspartate aminotransferase family protein n=1 Tax=bacterium (Candidatus Blackallbacteria) CG17_big_fil_post_rev_8_21_14_2_50_48_46 TaxID=2014261 RepID=A0A2M7G7E3_9BACT|nr:MAG: aspartate aminotransferase family protein [bacterium (Candidatus Blackallbacteria) CG18_big_fil_WC_8_21_14_2_50_49_26]PIW17871.1 MAG: aspartate aminotransferase family protein [bacterium (Candidatus Blackallbacteria) CG17_big_fil_post_rev_8_21_14_2_50_48_46]PIW48547.1 MAG: aspartate aminotransferase family protein [bacterium (Candidatus Blackallbacteria) CG13_big_fil_rev_8_21_14_2_50_49_14]
MEPHEFRQHAHHLVDWMADYLEEVRQWPVSPQLAPGAIYQQIPEAAPATGESFDAIFADFQTQIMPGMTHWQHPRFFGYFPANSSPPSVLAEMLTATLGAQCMSWLTSPAATELEERMLEWLRDLLGLPRQWVGVIQDTASTATFCAILSAREKASQGRANSQGLQGLPRYTLYCSSEAHSSIEKAVRMAGLGSENLRKIEVDQNFALQATALETQIQADRAAGYEPLCVVAAFGTTGSTAIDPLAEIAAICQREGLWLHIDAAFAGSALILPEIQALAHGLEYADSFVFNPHKWLLTNFDCSAYYVRDPQALLDTFALTPEYLKTGQDAQVKNFRDWGPQLGRRFRALKLWFVLRSYGAEGLKSLIQTHLAWAQTLAKTLKAESDFEVLAPVHFNTLCFRYAPPGKTPEDLDRLNPKLLEALNASGKLFMTHTRLRGVYVLRWVIGQTRVSWEDLAESWEQVKSTARAL